MVKNRLSQPLLKEDIVKLLYEMRKEEILNHSDKLFGDKRKLADDIEDNMLKRIPDDMRGELTQMIHLRADITKLVQGEVFRDGFECGIKMMLDLLD